MNDNENIKTYEMQFDCYIKELYNTRNNWESIQFKKSKNILKPSIRKELRDRKRIKRIKKAKSGSLRRLLKYTQPKEKRPGETIVRLKVDI